MMVRVSSSKGLAPSSSRLVGENRRRKDDEEEEEMMVVVDAKAVEDDDDDDDAAGAAGGDGVKNTQRVLAPMEPMDPATVKKCKVGR